MSKILVAEDERQLRMGIALSLKTCGYEVTEAENGMDALHAILHAKNIDTPFDMLICDIQMPKMTGEQLLAKLAELRLHLPTLVITGYGEKELLIRLMRAGCRDFIDKPFEPETLCRHVSAMVANAAFSLAETKNKKQISVIGERARQTACDLTAVIDDILGNATKAFQEIEPDHLTRLSIEKVLSASGRAAEICRSLLTAHDPAESPIPVMTEMSSLIAKVGILLRDIAPAAVKVTATALDHPVWLNADGERIQQALLHCGFRAFGAMPRGGELSMALEKLLAARPGSNAETQTCLAISMNVTGTGMPIERVRQMSGIRSAVRPPDAGFGLDNVIQSVVSEHNGWISVESECGEETMIRIFFPIIDKDCR